MVHVKTSYKENQQLICSLCLLKCLNCKPLSKEPEAQVNKAQSNTGGYCMNIHYYPTGICKRCASFLSGKTSVPENSLRLWHTPITFKTEKDCKECTVCTLASSFVRKIDFFNCVLTAFLRLDLVSIIDVKNNLKLKIYKKKIWYLQGQGISRGRIN